LQYFIEDLKFDINIEAVNKLKPIHIGCLYSKTAVVQYLASKGADLNESSAFGSTPMYLACSNKDDRTTSRRSSETPTPS
jgi:ankyrin repeat protein